MKILQKTIDIIKAFILCIRFPFLYPRNRYTDRYPANSFSKLKYKLFKESVLDIGITGKLIKDNSKNFLVFEKFLDIGVKLNKKENKVIVTNALSSVEYDLTHLIWGNKFDILGVSIAFALTGRPIITVNVRTKDVTDNTNYGFAYGDIQLITNKRKYSKYKFISCISKKIDELLIIPTYTELSTMPKGWRKAFGIKMCKEIKAELKKHKGALKTYRITQIKEKFGRLCWYDNCSNKEIQEIISKYSKLSRTICIECGKPAEYISIGWVSPYCNKCIDNKTKYIKMSEEHAWDKALYPEINKEE